MQLVDDHFARLRLHAFIHLDERRPGAFETFAGNFLRRVNAQLAAAGDFARRVVEHVGRAFGENAVALRIGVGREMEQHFARVVQNSFQCRVNPASSCQSAPAGTA